MIYKNHNYPYKNIIYTPIPKLIVDGLTFPYYFDQEKIREAIEFKAQKEDIFIVTYPKSGTTWMRYIVWSIQNSGKLPLPEMNQFSPFMERAGKEILDSQIPPRTYHTHLPLRFDTFNPEAKYIYVARNPRDTLVSYYHFTRELLGGPEYANVKFDDFFEAFINDDVPYGGYFDHILPWYNISQYYENILFVTFEDLIDDPHSVILKVAKFLGSSKTNEENDANLANNNYNYYSLLTSNNNMILNKIVKNTSFKEMKKMPVFIKNGENYGKNNNNAIKVNFFRKGIIGDWTNYFNKEQIQKLDQLMMDKFKDTNTCNLWAYVEA